MVVVGWAMAKSPKDAQDAIDSLEAKLKAGQARLARLKGRQRSVNERMRTRQKTIVGAALLADAAMRPESRQWLVTALHRAVILERDRTAIGNILAGDLRAYEKTGKGS